MDFRVLEVFIGVTSLWVKELLMINKGEAILHSDFGVGNIIIEDYFIDND